jgi:hypothetical protein
LSSIISDCPPSITQITQSYQRLPDSLDLLLQLRIVLPRNQLQLLHQITILLLQLYQSRLGLSFHLVLQLLELIHLLNQYRYIFSLFLNFRFQLHYILVLLLSDLLQLLNQPSIHRLPSFRVTLLKRVIQ